MPSPRRLPAFAGSLRAASFNRRLIPVPADGAGVTLIDLRDDPLRVNDGDIEAAGMPDNRGALQDQLATHDGRLISTPDCSGSLPALLKNTLDWISRPTVDGRSGTTLFADKVAGIVSASPGPLGGRRSLLARRDALSKTGLIDVPQQVAVGRAAEKLPDSGGLADKRLLAAVDGVGAAVVALACRRGGTHQ